MKPKCKGSSTDVANPEHTILCANKNKPKWADSKTKTPDAIRKSPTSERIRSRCAGLLKGRLDSTWLLSGTEKKNPNCAKVLRRGAKSGCKKSKTNEERSTRAQPRTGTAEPVLANCCGNKNEPVELGSNTNKSDPNHARLRGSIKGPR